MPTWVLGCRVWLLDLFWICTGGARCVATIARSKEAPFRLWIFLLDHGKNPPPFFSPVSGFSGNETVDRGPISDIDSLTSAGKKTQVTSFHLINLELNSHMRGRHIVWQRSWEPRKEGWRPVVWTESLWSAMWEFWGWDTASASWRRCPHCQRLFYPKRRDQFYCTPRQPALASKREYARRLRARQKRGKKPQNRESTRNRKEAQQ